MPKYAQIDVLTGKCVGVSFLSGEVEADNMIPLADEDNVNPNDTLQNGVWIPAPPPEPQPDRVAQLESENAELRTQQQQMSSDLQGFMDFYFSL